MTRRYLIIKLTSSATLNELAAWLDVKPNRPPVYPLTRCSAEAMSGLCDGRKRSTVCLMSPDEIWSEMRKLTRKLLPKLKVGIALCFWMGAILAFVQRKLIPNIALEVLFARVALQDKN